MSKALNGSKSSSSSSRGLLSDVKGEICPSYIYTHKHITRPCPCNGHSLRYCDSLMGIRTNLQVSFMSLNARNYPYLGPHIERTRFARRLLAYPFIKDSRMGPFPLFFDELEHAMMARPWRGRDGWEGVATTNLKKTPKNQFTWSKHTLNQ